MNPAQNSVDFTVCGVPAPQPRPRMSRRGVYNPTSANGWRSAVELAGRLTRADFKGDWVRVQIVFSFLRPASHYLRGELRANAPAYPGKSVGDIDNLVKSTLDALNDSPLWFDDSQVVDICAARVYADTAGARIRVWDARIGRGLGLFQ